MSSVQHKPVSIWNISVMNTCHLTGKSHTSRWATFTVPTDFQESRPHHSSPQGKVVRSVGDLMRMCHCHCHIIKTPRSISGRPYPIFVSPDARIATVLNSIIQSSDFRKIVLKKKPESSVTDRWNLWSTHTSWWREHSRDQLRVLSVMGVIRAGTEHCGHPRMCRRTVFWKACRKTGFESLISSRL